jgi:hypothetical protein
MFGECHPASSAEDKRATTYYKTINAPGRAYVDPNIANQSIQGPKELGASLDILIYLAHNPKRFEVLPLLHAKPTNKINDWKEKNYKE